MFVRLKTSRDSLKNYQMLQYFNLDAQNVISNEVRLQKNKNTDDRANYLINSQLQFKFLRIMSFPQVGSVLKCFVADPSLEQRFQKIFLHLILRISRKPLINYYRPMENSNQQLIIL